MTDANPNDGTDQPVAASSTSPTTLHQPWRALPVWWWILAIGMVSLSFALRFVDQATGRFTLVLAVFLALLIAAVRFVRAANVSLVKRMIPLATVFGIVAFVFGAIRVDEMNGNLVPQRVSFRWQPAPDQRLEKLVPMEVEAGIDLRQTTSNDFPGFLGKQRNGHVAVELDANWQANSPELIWKKDDFGAGHSGFAAVNGYAVTLEQRGAEEVVTCYEISTGNLVWSHAETARHENAFGGVGPRSTPAIVDGRVYTMGATGILLCLDGANGHVLWRKDFVEEIETTLEADLENILWGRAASPLVDQGRVIVPLGLKADAESEEKGATLVAFDAVTGDELWRHGSYQISYASPEIATIDGVRQILLVCESQACGFDADDGQPLWEFPWPGSSSGNASCSQAIPVDAHRVFLSKGYALGSALVDVRQQEGRWTAEEIWQKRVMKTKFTNAIVHEGHVYGLDDSILSCVELETGKRLWKRGRYGHGQILLAGSKLIVQTESGDVALVEPTPEEFDELARFSPIEGRTWNNLCLYGKTLLVRNSQQAACYRLP